MKCIAGIVNTEAGEENSRRAKENLASMLAAGDGEMIREWMDTQPSYFGEDVEQ